MERSQAMVAQFMITKGQPVKEAPAFIVRERVELRVRLIAEELQEYAEANGLPFSIVVVDREKLNVPFVWPQADLVEVYDSLVDLLYVVHGAALEHGMDLEPGLAEVHRSNMTKDGPKDAGGKIQKGPSYDPPRLAPIVDALTRAGR